MIDAVFERSVETQNMTSSLNAQRNDGKKSARKKVDEFEMMKQAVLQMKIVCYH